MLPKSMFEITTLSTALDLSYNFLSGTIPEEISNLKNLVQLLLSRNNLSGELPEGLQNCQILTILALDGNSFEGTIPSFLGKLKGLVYLNLSSNNFSGAIPEELGLINDLSELYLAKNNLSGNIPLALENMNHLSMLDISYNNINGPVPTNGVFSNASALILVGNYGLCGGIRELHLPKCLIHHNRKHSQTLLKFVIPIVSTILLLTFLLLAFLTLRRKNVITKESTGNLVLEGVYPKVSYGALAEATENFASSNLIGAGKYGRVYKGILQLREEHSSNQETHIVAVKVFDLQQLGSSKSFLAECEAFRVVRHRNLIRIRTCCSTIDYKEYGECGDVSTAGDVYSFGVLLLEMFTGRNPTEYMFNEGLTLHTFVDMAFPEQVVDIVDPNLIDVDARENNSINKWLDCLLSILKVGLICSKQSPAERMSMETATAELQKIRVVYLSS